MPVFLKILSAFYTLGAFLHLLDILGLRQDFVTMGAIHRYWAIYLLSFDVLTATLLIYREKWGIVFFHVVALSQLFAYLAFQDIFGRQDALVLFHVITLVLYWKIVARSKRKHLES